jgi:hypothetical protein
MLMLITVFTLGIFSLQSIREIRVIRGSNAGVPA